MEANHFKKYMFLMYLDGLDNLSKKKMEDTHAPSDFFMPLLDKTFKDAIQCILEAYIFMMFYLNGIIILCSISVFDYKSMKHKFSCTSTIYLNLWKVIFVELESSFRPIF